jgi:hypothetical protein
MRIRRINRVATPPARDSRINRLRSPSRAAARADRDSRRYDADTLSDITRSRPTAQGA